MENNSLLDLVKDIPYYSDNQQPFLWFARYINKDIIKEVDKYTYTSFTDIPKRNMSYFGLFGVGFHIFVDMINGSMFIYGTNSNKEFILENKLGVSTSSIFNFNILNYMDICPYELKKIDYDLDEYNIKKAIPSYPSKYILGYSGITYINGKEPINIKRYFSIDIINHTRSIMMTSVISSIPNIKYSNITYCFRSMQTIKKYDGNHVTHHIIPNTSDLTIDLNKSNKDYMYKNVFKF